MAASVKAALTPPPPTASLAGTIPRQLQVLQTQKFSVKLLEVSLGRAAESRTRTPYSRLVPRFSLGQAATSAPLILGEVMNFDEAEKKDPNTTNSRFQRMLIYFDTDAVCAHFRGHPLCKTTLKTDTYITDTMKNDQICERLWTTLPRSDFHSAAANGFHIKFYSSCVSFAPSRPH